MHFIFCHCVWLCDIGLTSAPCMTAWSTKNQTIKISISLILSDTVHSLAGGCGDVQEINPPSSAVDIVLLAEAITSDTGVAMLVLGHKTCSVTKQAVRVDRSRVTNTHPSVRTIVGSIRLRIRDLFHLPAAGLTIHRRVQCARKQYL